MQVVTQIDSLLANTLPLYGGVSLYAKNQYKKSLLSLNKIYTTSEARVETAKKTTKGLKKQAIMIALQSADDLLDYVEEKLSMEVPDIQEKNRSRRLVKIIAHLKDELILNPINKVAEFNSALLGKGKALNEKYILPLFISFKATVLVSRQIMLQVLAQRLGQLKMTYKVSKDSVTMFFTGEFDEQKILSRVSENINSFKQLTVNFVQKGMEIKISKRELFENYSNVVEKLTRIVRGVSTLSIEQWNDTKTKTVNLYQKVLNRIKEKEVQIKTEYSKEITTEKPTAPTAPVEAPTAEHVNDIPTSEAQAL